MSDPRRSEQWGLERVGADAAWLSSTGRRADGPVVVAVVDTGVDGTHPDLSGNVAQGFDALTPGNGWNDEAGHGTHVAGIIAAHRDNGVGGAGLAPDVLILPVRVLDADGVGDHEDIAEGIVWAVDAGADVINLSLGGAESTPVLESAVRYGVERGVVVVAAAGNARLEGNPVSYPAAYDGVIAVAAAAPDGRSAMFSNTGAYVDIAAPGFSIVSCVPGGYLNLSGTSQAAPFVAATAALLLAAGVDQHDVAARVFATTGPSPSPRDEVGAGFLDAGNAVSGVVTDPKQTLPAILGPGLPGMEPPPGLVAPQLPPLVVPEPLGSLPAAPPAPTMSMSGVALNVPVAAWGSEVDVRAVSFRDVVSARGPDRRLVPFEHAALDGSFVARVVAVPGSVDVLDGSGVALASAPMRVSPSLTVTSSRATLRGERLTVAVAPASPVVVWAQRLDGGVWVNVAAAVALDGVASIDVPAGSYRLVGRAHGLDAAVLPARLAR